MIWLREQACAALCLVQLVLVGCWTAERPFIWIKDLSPAPEAQQVIGPRDTILVVIANQPTMSGEFVVRDDGAYLQPLVGNLRVEGMAPASVALDLQRRLRALVVDPQITVSIARAAPVRVSVIGEVKTPGSYELTRDKGVVPALAAAGWLTEFASRDRIFVVRGGGGDRRIRFTAKDLTAPEPYAGRFRLRDGDVVVVE